MKKLLFLQICVLSSLFSMEMDESDYGSLSQVRSQSERAERAQGQKRRLPEQERVGAQPASKIQAIQDGNQNSSPQEITSLGSLPEELTAHILCCLVESEKHPLELVKTLINFGKTNKRNSAILNDRVVWNKIKQTYKTDPLKLAKVCVYAGNQGAITCLHEILSANPHLLNDLKKMITYTNLDSDLVDKQAELLFRRVLCSLTKCGISDLIDLDVLLDALEMSAVQGGIKTSRHLVSYLCDSHECDLKKLIRGDRTRFGKNSKIWPLAVGHDNPEIFTLYEKLTSQPFDPNHIIEGVVVCGKDIKFNVLKHCLENGADPNTRVDLQDGTVTPLMLAVSKESRNAVRLLLEKGANVNASAIGYSGYTPLMYALGKSDDIFQDLLDAGADVNARTSQNLPILHIAAYTDNTSNKIKKLLAKGADINQRDADGNTALMIAVFKGKVEAIRTLIEKKANVDMRNTKGHTPLMCAAAFCQPEQGPTEQRSIDELSELITTLKDAGADINARDNQGLTALALVIKHNADSRMISVLIKAGADPTLTFGNARGTLLQLAAAKGSVDAMRVLLVECATSPAERQNARRFAIRFDQTGVLNALIWYEEILNTVASQSVNKG